MAAAKAVFAREFTSGAAVEKTSRPPRDVMAMHRVYLWDDIILDAQLVAKLEGLYEQVDSVTLKCLFPWKLRNSLGNDFCPPDPKRPRAPDILRLDGLNTKDACVRLVYECLKDNPDPEVQDWVRVHSSNYRNPEWCNNFHGEMHTKRAFEAKTIREHLEEKRRRAAEMARAQEEAARERTDAASFASQSDTEPVEHSRPKQSLPPSSQPKLQVREDEDVDVEDELADTSRRADDFLRRKAAEHRHLSASVEAVKRDRTNLLHQAASLMAYAHIMVAVLAAMWVTVIVSQDGWEVVITSVPTILLVPWGYAIAVDMRRIFHARKSIFVYAVACAAGLGLYTLHTILRATLYNNDHYTPLQTTTLVLVVTYLAALFMLARHAVTLSILANRAHAASKAVKVGDKTK